MAGLSQFKLVHADSEAPLQTTGHILPEWAWQQWEVVTDKFDHHSPTSLWKGLIVLSQLFVS